MKLGILTYADIDSVAPDQPATPSNIVSLTYRRTMYFSNLDLELHCSHLTEDRYSSDASHISVVALEVLDSLHIIYCNNRQIEKYLNEVFIKSSRFLCSISITEAHDNV